MTDQALFLVDIGANLSHSSFSHDLEKVITDAKGAGVAHIIVTATDAQSIDDGIEIIARYPGFMSITVGFHPHVASRFDAAALALLKQRATHPCVVAIGETGLDFNRNYSPHSDQERAFAAQLELASELKKPVFLHQRDAHERFMPILKQYRPSLVGGVVHCFTDTKEALEDYLDLDMYIGVTGWICDERRGKTLQEIVPYIPRNRLLLETDAPYLLPRNIKPPPPSRRNEPRFLPQVLNRVAQCTATEPAKLAKQTSANAKKLFSLGITIPD